MWVVDRVESVDAFHCELAITSSENQSLTVKVHSVKFVGGDVDAWEIKEAESFEYGYAITAHKAQGSQWENVLIVFDGAWRGEQKEQWLYTAVTRAINRVVLCK
jgi:exodeoxyribonuclease-5